MDAYQLAVVREAIEQLAEAAEKISQQLRELKTLADDAARKLAA